MATDTEQAAVAASRQDFLRDAADLGEHRLKDFHTFDEYYVGEQRTLLMERARMYLQRSGFVFAENFCETIVDVMVERLRVEGFSAEGEETDDDTTDTTKDSKDSTDPADALAEWCSGVWQANRMDGKQGIVHTQTAVKSECGVIVDWDQDENRPRITVQRPETLKFVYCEDNPDELEYVVKVWNTTWQPETESGSEPLRGSELAAGTVRIRRMNLYWPDRVEKWFTTQVDGVQNANWHVWTDDGDAGWPVQWTRSDGSPRGIPVIHFRNKPKGRNTGRSELRGVIPQQDLLNKQILDLAGVMDHEGIPTRWATGVPDSSRTSFKIAPGEVWTAEDENAKFGQFDGADPGGLVTAIDSTLRRMAARSHTPLHLLNPSGVLPSGETLKTAEAPLVRKCQDRQTDWGNSWEDVIGMCVRLSNDFGGTTWDEGLTVQTQWEQAESRNDLGEAQTAQLWHDIGVSAHTLMLQAGFDPEEEAERRDEESTRAFDRGQLPGLPAGPGLDVPPDPSTVPPVEQ